MKPNDDNGRLPASERPFRVLIIAGSDRRQYNCPGVDSKARAPMLRKARGNGCGLNNDGREHSRESPTAPGWPAPKPGLGRA
jgi:hypothetical protein